MATRKQEDSGIMTIGIDKGSITFGVLGLTPVILNSMSSKVMQDLVLPRGKKTTAEKAGSLKHDPVAEFRRSPYTLDDDNAPTYLAHLATAFKQAIACTALDMPGAKKAQIGRLLWVAGERIPIYGIPMMHMCSTRSADMNRTPDVRTRCIVPKWACVVEVNFVKPILNETVVAQLFAAAGLIQGTGDWRPQKGSGTFGQFELVDHDDPRIKEIMKVGGRQAQIAAMKAYEPYDNTTRELLDWFMAEADRRGFKVTK